MIQALSLEEKSSSSSNNAFKVQPSGPLIGEVKLLLHTMDAQLLFLGYQKGGEVGLLHFAKLTNHLWKAALKDDPYADYYLLKIYEEIVRLQHKLTKVLKKREELFQSLTDAEHLQFRIFFSKKPVTKILWFNNPYGYLAAGLISSFDRLMQLS